MKKNRKISEYLDSIPTELQEKWREERIERICSTTESYQLGWLIGDNISRKIPVLTISGIPGNIPMEIGEIDYYNSLKEKWFNEPEGELQNEYWKEMRGFDKKMEQKYLPEKYSFYTPVLNISDMDEFKSGIRSSLWNFDFCNYKIKKNEDIQIQIDKDYYFMEITFMRN